MTDTVPRVTKAQRVREHLVAYIEAGLEPHDRLPTERELADEFEISRLTVRRALDQLENEGVVYRVQGAGTFVGSPSVSKSIELTSFSEDMRARGMVPDSRLVEAHTVPAGAKIGYPLRLSPASKVVHLRRIRLADDAPMCVEDCYLPEQFVPGLAENIEHGSLYKVLEQSYGLVLDRAEQVIKATVLEPEAAAMLEVPDFSPAFLVVRTLYDNRGRPIEHAESLYRADRYQYELTVERRA